jgi:hypothetical protein
MESDPPGLSDEQRLRFDRDGYFLVAGALTADETAELLEVIDDLDAMVRRDRRVPATAPVSARNVVCRHPTFLRLLDRPRILALVVALLGPWIQLRGSNLDVRPSQHASPNGTPDRFSDWHRDEPAGGWPTVGGVVPFMELKVGYYLTDLTQPDSGALRVLPGSHRWPQDRAVAPDGVTEINVSAGTALVWRTSLLHQVAPNHSGHTRKCVYLAYQHRWLRPSDYVSPPAKVLARCNPVQRQLLGALADGLCELRDPDVEPCSPYWTPRPADVPLEGWARETGVSAVPTYDLPPA